MKSLSLSVVASALLMSVSAQAARFVKVEQAQNADFAAIADFALALTENGALGNCGKAAVYEITYRHDSEALHDVVKQAYFFDSTQTDYVDTKAVAKSVQDIEKSVTNLTQIRYLAAPPAVLLEEQQLKELVLAASHEKDSIRMFSGEAGYSAPNVESLLNTLALVDETTNEVLIVNAGFCE